MNGFAQSPCRNCGATVWIPTNTGTGFCPNCHTPNTLSAQGSAQGGAPPSAQQQQQALGVAATMAMEAPPGGWGSIAQSQPQAPNPAQNPYSAAPQQGFGSQPGAPPSNQGQVWGAAPPVASGGGAFGAPPAAQAGPFGAPQQPPAGAPFGAPSQPSYGAPAQPPFGAPGGASQPGYGAPGQPFGAPGQPTFGAPAQGGYGAPPAGGQPPFGAPGQGGYGGPGGYAAPPAYTPPSGGGSTVLRIIGGVFLALIIVGVKVAARSGTKGCGSNSLSHYDITETAADPERMLSTANDIARRWQSDAVLHSITVLGLQPSGTVDLSRSGSVVTYEFFSPRRVSSFLERERRDSIKKVVFSRTGVTHSMIWGVRQRVENPLAMPTPVCTLSQLGRTLGAQGVTSPNGLQVNYSQTDNNFVGGALAWHVLSSSPSYNRWYDAGSCTPIRILQ